MAKNNTSTPKQITSWTLTAVFAIILFIVLFADYYNNQQDYLYTLHTHTFYFDNEPFFDEIRGSSAWGITLASRYLTQFFINPVFPTWLIPLLCLFQCLLLDYLLGVRNKKYGHLLLALLILPSLLAYTSGQNYDYAIYDRMDSSTYLTLFLGQLLSVCLFSVAKIKRYGVWISVALSALLYPFVGIFALVSIVMVSALCLTEKEIKKAGIVFAIFIALLLIMAFYGSDYFHEYRSFAILSPLINSFFGATFYYALSSLIILSLLPLLGLVREGETNKATASAIVVSLLCASLVSYIPAHYLTYKDANFYSELKAKRLLDNHEWKKLHTLTSKVKHPTPTIIAYQEIANVATEKLISKAFDLEPVFHYYNTNHFATGHFIHYADLAYYLGMPNVALFYAMETKQLSGNDFGVVKMMQESAMLNREYELAKKYQDLLASSPICRDYAEKWRGYIADTAKMYKENPHIRFIERLIDPTPALYSATSIQEILMHRDRLDNGMTLILRLYSDLYERDMEKFSQDIVASAPYFSKRTVPRAIQEACAICDLTGNPAPIRAIKVSPEIGNLTYTIAKDVNTIKNVNLARKQLYSRYKGTYTYYYMLSETDDSMYKGDLEKETK